MTQNKTTPLSEKAVSIGDIDYEDNSVSKRFFRKEDVKEAIKKLNNYFFDDDTMYKGEKIKKVIKIFFGKELCSDKEVAQPYSKSDKTTKGFILSDKQFQKEVDFAKKEIGGG